MDRIVRYLFCAAGIALTAGWLGSIATGYLPSSQRPRDTPAYYFNAAAGAEVSVTRNGRTVRIIRPPLLSLKDIFNIQVKRQMKDRVPAVL
jgi:hypothetical protein